MDLLTVLISILVVVTIIFQVTLLVIVILTAITIFRFLNTIKRVLASTEENISAAVDSAILIRSKIQGGFVIGEMILKEFLRPFLGKKKK